MIPIKFLTTRKNNTHKSAREKTLPLQALFYAASSALKRRYCYFRAYLTKNFLYFKYKPDCFFHKKSDPFFKMGRLLLNAKL